MAEAKIDILAPNDLDLVVNLYNQIFTPPNEKAFFERRFLGRYNNLVMVAAVDGEPVGFTLGFELKPSVYFSWLYGVLPDYRRVGIGSQLMHAVHAWAAEHGYEAVRLECHNDHRAMLHMCIEHRYDVLGVRWDPDRGANLVLFEKHLAD